MWHMPPPALLSCAEHSVPQPSPVLLDFPSQEPLQALWGHRPEACWVPGWGSQSGRMPVMETKVGTADWLPGIFQAVGGFGLAEVSYSPEPRLLLLKQKLPSISPVCRARQSTLLGHMQLCPTKAK